MNFMELTETQCWYLIMAGSFVVMHVKSLCLTWYVKGKQNRTEQNTYKQSPQ